MADALIDIVQHGGDRSPKRPTLKTPVCVCVTMHTPTAHQQTTILTCLNLPLFILFSYLNRLIEGIQSSQL